MKKVFLAILVSVIMGIGTANASTNLTQQECVVAALLAQEVSMHLSQGRDGGTIINTLRNSNPETYSKIGVYVERVIYAHPTMAQRHPAHVKRERFREATFSMCLEENGMR